mmetsp:Transcript_28778/g.67065  ORF Transcript_28778/g.67065 Transcript_28778/m.67065 type:complete len:482 (+) Transcript_28778:150-1595(+)
MTGTTVKRGLVRRWLAVFARGCDVERPLAARLSNVEGRVVLPEEGHSQDPQGAVERARVGVHQEQLAPRPRLERELPGPNVDKVGQVVGHGAHHLGDVGVGWEREGVPAHVKHDVGEVLEVAAVVVHARHHRLKLALDEAGHREQRRPAVDDGAATTVAAEVHCGGAVRSAFLVHTGDPHVAQPNAPGVPSNDRNPLEDVGVLVGAVVVPDEVAVGARPLPDAHGEHAHVEGLQQRHLGAHLHGHLQAVRNFLQRVLRHPPALVQVFAHVRGRLCRGLPGVGGRRLRRPDADDRLEGGAVQDGHGGFRHLPEVLACVWERTYGHEVKRLFGERVTAAVGVCRLEDPHAVGAAQPGVVLRRRAARGADAREDHQLVGSRVDDSSDELVANGEVPNVLRVSKIDHDLTVRLAWRHLCWAGQCSGTGKHRRRGEPFLHPPTCLRADCCGGDALQLLDARLRRCLYLCLQEDHIVRGRRAASDSP